MNPLNSSYIRQLSKICGKPWESGLEQWLCGRLAVMQNFLWANLPQALGKTCAKAVGKVSQDNGSTPAVQG